MNIEKKIFEEKLESNIQKKEKKNAEEAENRKSEMNENQEKKAQTSGKFKIKLNLTQIRNNPKQGQAAATQKEEPRHEETTNLDSKKKESRVSETQVRPKNRVGYEVERRVTRRMTRQLKNEAKSKVTQINLKNIDKKDFEEKLRSNTTLKKKVVGDIDEKLLNQIFDSEKPLIGTGRRGASVPNEEIIKNPQSYLAAMVNDTTHTGLDKRKFGQNRNLQSNWDPHSLCPKTKSGVLEPKMLKRPNLEIPKEEANSIVLDGESPNFKLIGQLPKTPNEEGLAGDGGAEGDPMLRKRPNQKEFQKRMKQDRKYREELKLKYEQRKKMQEPQVSRMHRKTNKRDSEDPNGEPMRRAKRGTLLNKRSQVDSIGEGVANQDMHLPMLSRDSHDIKRIKIRSNPPEKVNDKPKRAPKMRRINDSNQLLLNQNLSIKSEKLNILKEGAQNRQQGPNADLAENLSNFEEQNICINNGKNRPRRELPVEGESSERVQDHESGVGKHIISEKGYTKKIEKVFQKSANSSDREPTPNDLPADAEGHEGGQYKGLYSYLNYKRNMTEFLGFENAIEEVNDQKIEQRVHFLKERGGIDKNYWLNYYCSLIQKQQNLDYQDIMKGRLNCISYSLKEFNNHYNHKIHRSIFNMGKCIYRCIRDEIAMFERAQQVNLQQLRSQNYYNYTSNRYYQGAPSRPMGYSSQMESAPYSYVHPRMYYTSQSNHHPKYGEKYFPYHNEQKAPRNMKFRETNERDQRQVASRRRFINRRASPSEEDYHHQNPENWALDQKKQKLEIVRVNNEIGPNQSSPEPPQVEKNKVHSSRKQSQGQAHANPTIRKRRSRVKNKKEKSESQSEEAGNEVEEDFSKRRPQTRKEILKASQKKLNKSQRELFQNRARNLTCQVKPQDRPAQEPEGNESCDWIEYFSQIDYSKIKTDSRAYRRISDYFPFELKKVLEYMDQNSDYVNPREPKDIVADLSKLNKPKPFRSYFNPKQKNDHFSREYDGIQVHSGSDMKHIRTLGQFRKHIKDNFDLVTSTHDIANLLEKNNDKDIVWDLITQKDSGVKNFILHLKNKRFN